MEDQNPETFNSQNKKLEIKRYEWESMATAIYLGNKEIIKILEEKGIKIGKNPAHLEAAILSYRNLFAEKILGELNESNQKSEKRLGKLNEKREKILILNSAIFASSKNNNIKGAKMLIANGADINSKDAIF